MQSPCLSWSAHVLYFALRVAGRLPLRLLHAIGAALGHAIWRIHGRTRRITETNLALVLTQDRAESRHAIGRAASAEAGKAIAEIAKIWGNAPEDALALVRAVHGRELFDAALARGKGLIIAAPHLGCWELLNYWLAAQTPLAILYRAPRIAALEPLLRKARGALPVEQVRAEGSGVRALYKRLAAGGVVGILPDQKPREGTGSLAPFFSVPAHTMVLLPRLAERSGASVLFAFAERLPNGTGYHIHFLRAPEGIDDRDADTACTALNRGVEACVNRAFTQYQWQYKRFSPPPGSRLPNPYAR